MGQNYNRRDKFRRLATLGSRQNRGDRRGTDGKCVYAQTKLKQEVVTVHYKYVRSKKD